MIHLFNLIDSLIFFLLYPGVFLALNNTIPLPGGQSQNGAERVIYIRPQCRLDSPTNIATDALLDAYADDPPRSPDSFSCPLPPTATADATITALPHAVSALEEAAASGDLRTLQCAAEAYKARHPAACVWQHCAGRGLWQDHAPAPQAAIRDAAAHGRDRVEAAGDSDAVALDLRRRRQSGAGGASARVRCRLRPLFGARDPSAAGSGAGPEWRVKADPAQLPPGAPCVVLLAPGTLAAAPRDAAALALLLEEGLTDPSHWAPPAKAPERLAWRGRPGAALWENALRAAVAAACGGAQFEGSGGAFYLPAGAARDAQRAAPRGPGAGARDAASGIKSRLTDGLREPAARAAAGPLYDAGYAPKVEAVPFCLALPGNDCGYVFREPAVVDMIGDAMLKWHELQRRPLEFRLTPAAMLPVYVYTYELPRCVGRRVSREGGSHPPPPEHSCPDSTPKSLCPTPTPAPTAFPTASNRPPATAFTSSLAALEPLWNGPDRLPPKQSAGWGAWGAGIGLPPPPPSSCYSPCAQRTHTSCCCVSISALGRTKMVFGGTTCVPLTTICERSLLEAPGVPPASLPPPPPLGLAKMLAPQIPGGGVRKGAPGATSLFPEYRCLKVLAPTVPMGGGGGHTARRAMDGLWTEVCGKQQQSNDPRNNQHNPQCANYWAPLTRKRHIPPHPAKPRHTNDWAPRTRKRRQQEHRPQRPTERSDPTQHAKGRTGDCPGPRKGATTRRHVTQGGGGCLRTADDRRKSPPPTLGPAPHSWSDSASGFVMEYA